MQKNEQPCPVTESGSKEDDGQNAGCQEEKPPSGVEEDGGSGGQTAPGRKKTTPSGIEADVGGIGVDQHHFIDDERRASGE